MTANNYAKQPNGRIVDISFACYATDYLLFVQCFILYYRAKNISRKINNLSSSSRNHLSLNLIFNLLPYMIITEACGLLLGALFHHLYPGQQIIFDTAGWFSNNCSMIFMILIICTFKSTLSSPDGWLEKFYKYAAKYPRHIIFITGILTHIEQNYVKVLCFKKIKALLYLIGFLSTLIVSENKLKSIHHNFSSGFNFKLRQFRIACFLFMTSAVYYLKIESGCRKPNAYSQGSCPLPDSFNHNAFIHVAFGIVFQLVVGSWEYKEILKED